MLVEVKDDAVDEGGLAEGNGTIVVVTAHGNAEGKFDSAKIRDVPFGLERLNRSFSSMEDAAEMISLTCTAKMMVPVGV